MGPTENFTCSTPAMSTTFFLSNMAPQRPGLKPRPMEAGRKCGETNNEIARYVWLFTGPIFIGKKPIQEIGAGKVAIPTHFPKVILCVHPDGTKEMFASIMPNIAKLQTSLGKYATLWTMSRPYTEPDFFAMLPTSEQADTWSQS